MSRNAVFLFLINFMLYQSQAGPVSYFITPCKADDNTCMLASFKKAQPIFIKGIPELKIPTSDPLEVKDVKSDGNNLNFYFKDMIAFGLSKCDVIEAKRDAKAETMTFVSECPIKLVGKYTANGKVVFVEIVGDGDVEIDIKKIKINLVVNVKTVDGDDGKKHWKFTGFDYTYEFEVPPHIKLTNLFGGDESKAKPIMEAINAGWKELLPEVGEPLIKQTITKLIVNVNKLFHVIATDELESA